MEAHWKECRQAEEGILSYPIVGLLRLMGKGQVWQELHGGVLSAGLVAFCRKCSVSLGTGALCQGLSGLCTIKAGAWFLAISQTCSQGTVDSSRATLYQFCSLLLWTEFLGG